MHLYYKQPCHTQTAVQMQAEQIRHAIMHLQPEQLKGLSDCMVNKVSAVDSVAYLGLGIVLALLDAIGVGGSSDGGVEVGHGLGNGSHLVGCQALGEGCHSGCIRLGGHQLGSDGHDGGQGGGVGQVHGRRLQQPAADSWGRVQHLPRQVHK